MKESILRAAPSNGDDPHIDLSELDRAVEEAAHETAASAIETVNKSSRDAAAVNEVDRAREDLKRRIRAAHQAAQRDHAYAVDEIARIDKVMAMYQSNRMALQAIREEAEDRIVKAKFAMARFV